MSPPLKPCPHCGGIAEIDTLATYRAIYDGQMRRGASIYCLSCDAQMMRCYADHPGEERENVCDTLVEAWNTRADATRIAALEAESARWREALVCIPQDVNDPAQFARATLTRFDQENEND